RHGRWRVVRWLLLGGAMAPTVAALQSRTGALALHYAAAKGCLDCVILLTESCPELGANTPMENHVTPVYLAAQEGHVSVLQYLVTAAGGNLNVRARDGMAPLHAAAQMGALECVKWMVEDQGLDPNLSDNDGATAAHFAASRGHVETLRWLLAHGAALLPDKFGKSPFHDAAENEQLECLAVLIGHVSNPELHVTQGKSGGGTLKRGAHHRQRAHRRGAAAPRNADARRNVKVVAFSFPSPAEEKKIVCVSAFRRSRLIGATQGSPRKHAKSVPQVTQSCSCPGPARPSGRPSRSTRPPQQILQQPQRSPCGRVTSTTANGAPASSLTSSATSSPLSRSSEATEPFFLHEPHMTVSDRVRKLFESAAGTNTVPTTHLHVGESAYSSGDAAILSVSGTSPPVYESHMRKNQKSVGSSSSSNSSTSTDEGICQDDAILEDDDKRDSDAASTPQSSRKAPSSAGAASSASSTTACGPEDDEMDTAAGRTTIFHSSQLSCKSPTLVKTPNQTVLKPVAKAPTPKAPPPTEPKVPSQAILRPTPCSAILREAQPLPLRNKTLPRLFERPVSFIPPQFMQPPDSDTNLKPSEYLKTVSNPSTLNGTTNGQNETNGNCDESPTASLCDEKVRSSAGSHTDGDVSSSSSVKSMPSTPCSPQPNGGIFSITKEQLQNVQLKRTDKPSTLERCVLLQKNGGALLEQKSTIIEELKQSMDGQGVHGVRKMKEERLRMEEEKEKKKAEELLQQISAKNFVDTIPEKDVNGCVIPAWKRQMLAKKAAEKARKEAEEVLQREAEAKKWTSVPAWKRHLLMKNGDSTLPGHKTLGNKPLTASLSCPATPTQTLPQPVTCSQPATPSQPEGPSEAVPPAQDKSLVIEEEDKPPNPFLQQGLRKVNVRLH
ncbi:unnamed protein product, partial [Ixodes hexagonus]